MKFKHKKIKKEFHTLQIISKMKLKRMLDKKKNENQKTDENIICFIFCEKKRDGIIKTIIKQILKTHIFVIKLQNT